MFGPVAPAVGADETGQYKIKQFISSEQREFAP
jgi:hypothetical protein